MQKDWTRDPVWGLIAVILAAIGIGTVVILAPSDKQPPLLILCIVGALIILFVLFGWNPLQRKLHERDITDQKTLELVRKPPQRAQAIQFAANSPQKPGRSIQWTTIAGFVGPLVVTGVTLVALLFWRPSWYNALVHAPWYNAVVNTSGFNVTAIVFTVISLIASIIQYTVISRKRSKNTEDYSSYPSPPIFYDSYPQPVYGPPSVDSYPPPVYGQPLVDSYPPPINPYGPPSDLSQLPANPYQVDQ